MSMLEAVLRHYKGNERKSVLVPEWKGADGKPMRVYWTLLTYAERSEMTDLGQMDDISVVVRKAQDAEGKPCFAAEDKMKLERAAAVSIFNRLSGMMLDLTQVTEEAVEDARKN